MKALPPTGSASGQVIASFGVALVVGGIIALVIRQRKETK
jgi:LPXTG-motif cell wall-anchored protein